MESLHKINDWYQSQCDGDWEHLHGVTIESCDNPGWWVKIDLTNTPLENVQFEAISEGVNEAGHPVLDSWFHCYVLNSRFNGAGDPSKLEQVLNVFVDWAKL